LGIDTNGRVPTLDEAKAQFRSSWNRVCEQQSMPDRLVSRTTAGANE